MAHASNAVEKDRIAQLKTAADFNAAEELRKAEEAAKTAEKPLEAKMTKCGTKFICGNKGCAIRSFKEEENHEAACHFHKGDAIFHDLKKYWSCCEKVAYDWDDFMKIPTCMEGPHAKKFV